MTTKPQDPTEERPARVWPLLLLLLAAGVVLVAVQLRRPKPPNPWIGRALPPLEAGGWLNSDGPLSAEDLRGNVVLVDFWSTDCPACVSHTPELVDYYERFGDEGVVVVGLTHESATELQRVKQYVDRANIGWPIGYGAGFTFELMGITGTPTYVLYDRAGRSVWGGHSLDGLAEATIAALARK